MRVSSDGDSQLGFTIVFCSGRACESALPVRERLAATARGCAHGMLVGSPCLLGPHGCPGNVPAAVRAPVLLAQHCAGPERRPIGPTLTLGPLRSRRDLEGVCQWLTEPAAAPPLFLDLWARQLAARSN
ncbi:MAG TPA: hypothetical protein VHV82_08080 [Sporichthyaceae bacterium]|jgi:hypothetical protein|nr:hypothetical protein [Sporichthyaceae bacterium]